jgi:hypothetical protein
MPRENWKTALLVAWQKTVAFQYSGDSWITWNESRRP